MMTNAVLVFSIVVALTHYVRYELALRAFSLGVKHPADYRSTGVQFSQGAPELQELAYAA